MNFLTVSKEQKLEIYNKRINDVEREMFTKVLELGIDPDFFENSFQDLYKAHYLKEAISNCQQQDQANLQNNTPNNNPSSKIYKIIEYIKTFL